MPVSWSLEGAFWGCKLRLQDPLFWSLACKFSGPPGPFLEVSGCKLLALMQGSSRDVSRPSVFRLSLLLACDLLHVEDHIPPELYPTHLMSYTN